MSDPVSVLSAARPALTVALPAYREAENLGFLLPQIRAAAAALTPGYEILIVDTEQPMDNTAEICAENGVRHVSRRGGNTYGDAIRTMIAEARGEYLLCMDADGSHSPEYFASMWAERERYDITIGSRYAPGGHTENPAVLIWMSYLVNLTFRVAFSIKAKDITNSFRLYRHAVLRPLKLESNDFDILEEILIKASVQHPGCALGRCRSRLPGARRGSQNASSSSSLSDILTRCDGCGRLRGPHARK